MALYSPAYEDWRFVLASRRLDAIGLSQAYGLVHNAVEAVGIPLERTPPLLILEMFDPFVRTLRGMLAKNKRIEAMRLGGQLIGDHFVEDALVYRVR